MHERFTVIGYNRIIIIGNLTRDPDYKQLASGQAVCQLGIASNRQYRNKQTANMVQEVCFVDVDVFGAQAESCRQYLQKGRSVLVEGRLKLDSWETPEGQKRSKHTIVADRVVFLGSGSAAELNTEEQPAGFKAAGSAPKSKKSSFAPSNAEQGDNSMMTDSFQDEPPFQDDLPF